MIDVVGGPPRPIPANDDDVKLTVDCTVQTTVELKAHQVGKKGIGSFGNDKSFQPIDWDKEGGVSRSEKCLVMPKGLRGVVVSMFDTSSKSSISHPVRVKFLGGDGLGGEYTPPVTFQMHFKTSEVELVDEQSSCGKMVSSTTDCRKKNNNLALSDDVMVFY